jgi:protein-S-isoprenylcysteine O-methyltransferase Ste14
MGGLLLFNSHSKAVSSPLHRPYWLGMIICNIFVVKMVDTTCSAICVPSFIYLVGTVFVILSLFSLWSSFAVIPMLSKIRTRYTYSIIRHPMYLGEIVMLLSCVIASETVLSLLIFLIFLLFTILRIQEEENLLLQTNQYKEYCSNTRWKLLPYIW